MTAASSDPSPQEDPSNAPGAEHAPAVEPQAHDEIPPVSPAALILPVVTSIAILLLIFLFVSHDAAVEVFAKALATMTFAGKFAVLLASPDGFLTTPYKMAALVTYMDMAIGIISVFNVGVLYRIPGFGRKLLELREFAIFMLHKNPWMRKATFAGTCAFVMFPLSGTGAIGGAFFGQLLGMTRRRTLVAIFVGAVIGSFGLAALANTLPENLKDSWAFKAGGLIFILICVAILTKLYKKMDPEAMREASEETPDS